MGAEGRIWLRRVVQGEAHIQHRRDLPMFVARAPLAVLPITGDVVPHIGWYCGGDPVVNWDFDVPGENPRGLVIMSLTDFTEDERLHQNSVFHQCVRFVRLGPTFGLLVVNIKTLEWAGWATKRPDEIGGEPTDYLMKRWQQITPGRWLVSLYEETSHKNNYRLPALPGVRLSRAINWEIWT